MSRFVVRIVTGADGHPTPHDGRWVQSWNPHTEAGTLELISTIDPVLARRFPTRRAAMIEWNSVSRVQPCRPWDGRPNKPLSAVMVEIMPENEMFGS